MLKNKDSLKHEHDYYYEMADFFSIFADCTRIKILHTLLDGGKCVKKICSIVGIKQSTCSHQLKLLRQYKVVKAKRDGRLIRYFIDDYRIEEILAMAKDHFNKESHTNA
jgi:DNA-binding transcriptional ArsR family regulator